MCVHRSVPSPPPPGITQVHTAGGVHSLSIGMDGTAQLFDPWGAGSPAAGGGGLTVLQSEVVLLQHSPHPPKTLVRGVAASRNGVYFTTVIRYCVVVGMCMGGGGCV